MGNAMNKIQGKPQAVPAAQPQYVQQPVMQPMQPQFVQQPQYAQQAPRPQFVQQPVQPQYIPQQPQFIPQQPQFVPQQPQFAPQQPQFAPQQSQYRPPTFTPQQPAYRPTYPPASAGPSVSQYPTASNFPLGGDRSQLNYYENDSLLANLTGWSLQDIERLRHEFMTYANPSGVIDRIGFMKLYVASVLNMTWEALESQAEAAFRNFDVNQTGALDFNEFVTACSRMTRDVNASYQSSPPPTQNNSSYQY